MSTKLVIAEDHPIIRMGIRQILLKIDANLDVIETDTCVGVVKIAEKIEKAFYIVDLNLKDGLSLSAIEQIIHSNHENSIMVFTTNPGEVYVKHLFKIGIRGFLNKLSSEEEIAKAFSQFMDNKIFVSEEYLPFVFNKKERANKQNAFQSLSNMELTVVEYLVQGVGIKDIAPKMSIMSNTVATYKKRAFAKLEIENIIQLNTLYQQFALKKNT